MPKYHPPRARNDSRRLKSRIAVQYLFLISALFSLTACINSSVSSMYERSSVERKPIAAPKAVANLPVEQGSAATAPASAVFQPAEAVTEATAAATPAAETETVPVVIAALTPATEAETTASVVAAVNPAAADTAAVIVAAVNPAAALAAPEIDQGGLINQNVCTQGLRGELITARAGRCLLDANGVPADGEEAVVTAGVRPAAPLVAMAPSAGTEEPNLVRTSLNLKAGLTQSLLVTAYEQTGRHYAAGGQNPAAGFDAAGYVRWVYAQRGLNLPGEALKQAGGGRQVAKDDLRPGDLLVYRDPDGKSGGYHVGIYTGQGNFIHATAKTGVVTETAAFGPQYSPYFVSGRRYFDDPKAAPLSDSQKMAAASSAVKLALSELGPDDKLVKPAAARSAKPAKSGKGKSKKP